RASRRSSTPADASPGSRSVTPRSSDLPAPTPALRARVGAVLGPPAASTAVSAAHPSGVRMFEAVETLVAEHGELEERMADPAVHSDQGLAKKLGQRYAELTAIVRTYRDFQQVTDD